MMTALLLSGCGFHLRGMHERPQWLSNVTLVIENENRDLGAFLSQQLKANGISTNTNPSSATYWLIIEKDHFQQQVGSISSSTTPRQYQLFYSVQFKLQHAKGKDILSSSQVVVTRQVTLNSERILGSTHEEDLTKAEMQKDAAMQIIDRLSRAHEH